ncbi:Pycsar system effector family protein [Streptomyces malaysiensis]|uniref:Pycsar system effector family protein n=1 Tax=Streptomyces malaysiensis TaxID=92644 RepID=UPI000BFDD02F|nr:Pycsar system effector family protein [Streptomyces malaysiensis]ATL80246.1 mobile element transfer protein SpdB [Streptomyces malaysiensis]
MVSSRSTTAPAVDAAATEAAATVAAEITKADSKAAHVITFDGILLAALAAGGRDLPPAGVTLAALGAAALALSVVLALLSVLPRLRTPQRQHGPQKPPFAEWAQMSTAEIRHSLENPTNNRIERLRVLSGIAMRKMQCVSISIHASISAFGMLSMAFVSGAL